MNPFDPSPYVGIYVVIVFLVPWAIYGSYVVRGLVYARSKGISLFTFEGSRQIRELRQTDRHAAFLHRRALKWAIITGVAWFVGFLTMCLTIYFLHRRGIV